MSFTIGDPVRSDQLSGFLAFAAVARRGSFTAAGVDLAMSASAVSQSVAQLEARLGARLFDRTTRRVQLTEVGSALFARVAPALEELVRAQEQAQEQASEPSGTLRINAPHLATRLFLEPMLPGFLAAYPEVHVEIAVEDALTDIVGEGFDCGVRLGESLHRDMVAVRLGGDQETALIASPRYLKRRGVPKTPADLRQHDCISFRSRTTGGLYRWELVDRDKDVTLDVAGRLTVNDIDLAMRAARDGLGIAYGFLAYVDADLKRGRLVRVLERYSPRFAGFYLYYSSRRLTPPKLRAFLEHCRAQATSA
jgi:DNA-binding transcriptional LysR family regulator